MLKTVPTDIRCALRFGARPFTQEETLADGGSTGVGIGPHFSVPFFEEFLVGTDGSPSTFTQVRPMIFPQSNNIDLDLFVPILAYFERGTDGFAFVNNG
jgi:hypothetical protein